MEWERLPDTTMEIVNQSFSLNYDYPVIFTEDVFNRENPVFSRVVNRLESDRRHRLFFVIDENVSRAHPQLHTRIAAYAESRPQELELVCEPLQVVGGEAVKADLRHVLTLVETMNRLGLDRQSFMVIVGGGAVLDAAGFAASICHRGVRVIRIPSTVLAQSDSGVGVKNGVNLFGKKNFLGAFSPPFAVVNDRSLIETLEHRDQIAGIAEAVKVALIRDRPFFEYLEKNVSELSRGVAEPLHYQIRRSAELHLEHIRSSGDPFEFGSARPLDFGHWSAHKLESMTRSRLRHGEAVAIGMALDLVYSVRAGFLKRRVLNRVLSLLRNLGLPVWDEALSTTRSGQRVVLEGLTEFREHLGGKLHISLIRDIGDSFEVTEMDDRLLLDSIEWLRHSFGRVGAGVAETELPESARQE
jgi:3-dehydroquinate synthase